MLRSVYENWISVLGERDFDQPFMNLIRGLGFFDIHFTHGPFEFGKDFIAKRQVDGEVIQYAFQSKAGDIGGSEWTAIRGQLDDLVDAWVVHPNFDTSLPREFRLVTTGRLKGKAGVSAQQYGERLRKRDEGNFEAWDRESLLDFLEASDPRQPSVDVSEGFRRLVAKMEANATTTQGLEQALSDLAPTTVTSTADLDVPLLETSLLVARYLSADRMFDAITCAAHAVRLAAVTAYADGIDQDDARSLIASTVSSYAATAERFVEEGLHTMEPLDLAKISGGPAALVSYPVVCMRVMESFGLLGLWYREQGNTERFAEMAEHCRRFVEVNPGAHKPISERYAVSFAPIVLTLHLAGHHDTVQQLLKEATRWVCDRYEQSEFGLASPYATPKEEVDVLLGAPFEFIDLTPSRESTVAVALADLAYYCATDLYPAIVNDLKAVEIAPSTIFPNDAMGAMFFNRGNTSGLVNITYPDDPSAGPIQHHQLQVDPRTLEVVGGVTLPLIVSTVLRDRLYSDCYQRAAALSV